MYSFKNDYAEGAHPRILEALADTNLEQADGYGEDAYTKEALSLIRARLGGVDADVHLFAGGTETNLTAISAFLRPHEAVISAHTGHVLVHETGAIEATGHKVIAVSSDDGKLCPEGVAAVVRAHTDEHMVKPKLVYISDSTEIGTIYSLGEMEELRRCCDEHSLLLFLDGARLGSALCASGNDLTLPHLARLTDAFYIGGTKNGALIGEALVINRESLKTDFRFHMKQKGALLAKGRLLGIQFGELFRDDLFFLLASHANKMAGLMRDAIVELGYGFLIDSPTNQIFPIFPNSLIRRLERDYLFYVWQKIDDENSALRLVTSWATDENAVLAFIRDLREASKELLGL